MNFRSSVIVGTAIFLATGGCASIIDLGVLEKVSCIDDCGESGGDASLPRVGNEDPLSGQQPTDAPSRPHSTGSSGMDSGSDTVTPGRADAEASSDAGELGDAGEARETGPVDAGQVPVVDACATCTPPLFAGPSESFDNGILQADIWTLSAPSNGQISERNSQLEILPIAGAREYASITSKAKYDVRGREVRVEVTQVLGNVRGSEAFLQLEHTSGVFWMGTRDADMVAAQDTNRSTTYISTRKYDSVAMRWWRLREANGRLYAEYAANATGPWQQLANAQNPFSMNAVAIALGAGATYASPAPSLAAFDNLNR
jgi:hypothetical protein